MQTDYVKALARKTYQEKPTYSIDSKQKQKFHVPRFLIGISFLAGILVSAFVIL